MKFQKDFDQNSLQELDDNRTLMKFFKYFNQNSSGQLQYPTIQMAIQSFKSSMTTEFLGSSILIRIVLIHLKKERKSCCLNSPDLLLGSA